ncbi:helix-turn-helix domain-containing protein [candidate division KSB1 bacterium]|nr:helix-turn-helix domain-containing protein [candidate division KSB1 bacterium]
MDDKLFDRLVESTKQAIEISEGKVKEFRSFTFELPEDIKTIRNDKLQMSQEKFAAMLGVSIRTLQEWEQGRRKPSGAAKSLLKIASFAPEVVLKALTQSTR